MHYLKKYRYYGELPVRTGYMENNFCLRYDFTGHKVFMDLYGYLGRLLKTFLLKHFIYLS